jgi:hypothetical protein
MKMDQIKDLGLVSGEFNSLSASPTTEDIHTAMKRGRWMGSDAVKGALGVLFEMKHVEQFNFGPLSLDTIREAQKEAMEFIEFGCFSLPYPECVFRCSVAFDNRTVGFHMFNVLRDAGKLGDNGERIATICTIHSDTEVLSFRADNTLEVVVHGSRGKGVTIVVPEIELKFWEPHIGPIKTRGFVEDSNGAIITEGALITMGLTMILNTKGVLKERTAPPAKPNKVRAARGVPLLPYTTKVYTSVYNQAVRSGPVGTHASPRPHRRRAHVRHYPKTEKRDAYVLPIAAMLVNWDGQPLPDRAEYTVKHG